MVRRRLWRAGIVAIAVAQSWALPAQDAPSAVVLGVTINESKDEYQAFFLRQPDGLWMRVEDFDQWRIVKPRVPPVEVGGFPYLPLSKVAGARAEIDESSQSVKLTVPIDAFAPQNFSGNTDRSRDVTPSIASAFVNYEIAAEASSDATNVRGFIEAGTSADWGLATSTFTIGSSYGGGGITRLDSYLLYDNPKSAIRLTVGDAITSTSAWSRPIRYGGVKVGTDFGLRPGYITFPTANFQGRTVLPSSVEFYADGALRYRRDVDRGPFAIDQAPLPAGAGQLTVVTRDVLGIERQTTTPYYVSTNLLRAGLSRYSFEIGLERDDYGQQSFDYSRPFAAGLYRKGLTDRLTIETRTELGSRIQDAGLSIASALPRLGEFGGTMALSKGGGGLGLLYGAYFNRTSPRWDLGLSIQQTNSNFTQLGIRRRDELIRRQVQGNAGRTLGRFGHIGISVANLRTADHVQTSVISASYSLTVGKGYFDAFAVLASSNAGPTNSGVGIGFTLPLGPRSTARVGAELQNGKIGATADYRVAAPTDQGWGYGANVRAGVFDQQRADATYVGDDGELRIEAARTAGQAGVRANARGGIAFAEGSVFTTRHLEGAFGIVNAAGYGGVRVYQDNRPLTRTNAKGLAIIPALRPYEENAIRLAPDDMPIGARVDADDIVLAPGYRKGVAAHFKVKAGRPALIVMTGPDGGEIPAGTTVIVDGGREQTFAGYDGNIFVSDARQEMKIEAELTSGKCMAMVALPAQKVDLPQIGPVRCAIAGEPK